MQRLVGQCRLFRRQRLLTRVALDLLVVRLRADLLAGLGTLGELVLFIGRQPGQRVEFGALVSEVPASAATSGMAAPRAASR